MRVVANLEGSTTSGAARIESRSGKTKQRKTLIITTLR